MHERVDVLAIPVQQPAIELWLLVRCGIAAGKTGLTAGIAAGKDLLEFAEHGFSPPFKMRKRIRAWQLEPFEYTKK
jgi:hypothetical protein